VTDSRWARTVLAASVVISALIMGCASGPRLYVNPEADVGFYKKVAVAPFGNLTGERYAGARVSRAFVTELVMADRYQIVDPAEVAAALDRNGALTGGENAIDPKKLRDAATEAGANGMIRGAVTEYSMQRNGSSEIPVLAFDIEMIDVATGNVVWRGSVSRRGKGRTPVFGGAGTRTFGRLTEEACREIVARLKKEAF
jgi:curli biogenesis system outer membrane secretion channel CsgG